jgi:hypothetical protein
MLYLYILSDKNTEIQRMYIGCIKSNISQNKASYKNIFVSQWWMYIALTFFRDENKMLQ